MSRRRAGPVRPGHPADPQPRRGADLRLLPALLAAEGLAYWATGAGARAAATAGAGLLVAGLGAALAGRRAGSGSGRVLAGLVTVAAVGAAVLGVTASRSADRERGPVPGWAAEQAVVEVSGQVVSDARPVGAARQPVGAAPADRFALDLTVGQVSARGRTVRTAAALVLFGDARWRDVTAGQQVQAVGRLRPADPGDAAVALLAAQGGPRSVGPGSWPWRLADRLRAGLRAACRGLPADAGGLLPSLVVGDTSALPATLRTDLQAAGLTHLTAVSGANVALSGGAALWLAAAVGAGRRARLATTALVLAALVVVARPQPSVLRAAVMGGIALAALATGRRSHGLPVLAGAGVLLLCWDPWLARSAGFVLSCLATGGLLLLAPAWTRALSRRVPSPVAVAVAVPAAAQAVCGPVLVLLQPAVSVVSVPANLLAEPAVAPATVLGLVAAALAPVSPGAAVVVARLAGVATGWIALVAHRAAAVPCGSLPWAPGAVGAVVLAAHTLVLVVATTRTRPPPAGPPAVPGRRRPRRAGTRRRVALVMAAVGLIAGTGWWFGARTGWWGDGRPPGDWAVAQCDVGQGAAMAVRSGPDRAVLVDAGPDPRSVDRCLTDLGVHGLDLVLLTHFHSDHVAGLPGALSRRDVGEVLVSPLAEPAENVALVAGALGASGRTARPGSPGLAGRAAGGGWEVSWQVLATGVTTSSPGPPGAASGRGGEDDGTAINDASLAYLLDVGTPNGHLRLAGLGDLETAGQEELLAVLRSGRPGAGPVAPVDVVEVAHHGSARQVPALYQELGARIGLIGVGAGNDYGHPAPSALALLRRIGTRAVRTDLSGLIVVAVAPGGGLRLVTARGPPPLAPSA